MNRSADAVFNSNCFVDDVLDWLDNHDHSRRWLAGEADLDLATLCGVLRRTYRLSLLTACVLADVCDLSLDDYRAGGKRDRAR